MGMVNSGSGSAGRPRVLPIVGHHGNETFLEAVRDFGTTKLGSSAERRLSAESTRQADIPVSAPFQSFVASVKRWQKDLPSVRSPSTSTSEQALVTAVRRETPSHSAPGLEPGLSS